MIKPKETAHSHWNSFLFPSWYVCINTSFLRWTFTFIITFIKESMILTLSLIKPIACPRVCARLCEESSVGIGTAFPQPIILNGLASTMRGHHFNFKETWRAILRGENCKLRVKNKHYESERTPKTWPGNLHLLLGQLDQVSPHGWNNRQTLNVRRAENTVVWYFNRYSDNNVCFESEGGWS